MQILTRLKKTLIMVREGANRGSCTSQSKLELNSVSFRARFHQDTIGLERNLSTVQMRFYRGLSGIRSGFGRDPFRLERNLNTVQFR